MGRHRQPASALVLTGAVGLSCLLPPARNVGPGMYGYLWTGTVITVALVLAIATREVPSRSASRTGLTAVLAGFVPFALLVAWGAISLSWSTTPYRRLALGALALAGMSALLPAVVVARLDDRRLALTLRRVCGAALGASAVAAVLTVSTSTEDFRLALPLGPASASYLPVTLCVAVGAGAVATTRGPGRWGWGFLVLLGCALVVTTDSRAGLAALVIVIWIAAARLSRPGLGRIAIVLGGGSLAVGAAFAYLRWRRPGAGLGDGLREQSYAQGLEAWSDSIQLMVAGRGSGSLWPWLAVELKKIPTLSHEIVIESPWGDMLYHAHSTFLGVLVELGIIGLALLLLTLAVVAGSALRSLRSDDPQTWLPAVALLVTLPGMALETYLLRGFPGALVWWVVALAVVRWGSRASGSPSIGRHPR